MDNTSFDPRPVFDREEVQRDGSIHVIYARHDGTEFMFRVPPPKKSVPAKFMKLVPSDA